MKCYIRVFKQFKILNTRTRRSEFWQFTIINAIVLAALFFLLNISTDINKNLVQIIAFTYTLIILIPSISIAIRRLHDVGKSGLWLLFFFVPLLGQLSLLIFFLQDSQLGYNKWGEYPKFIHCF